jgi:hypothetical protein
MRGVAGLCQPAVWIDGLYVALGTVGTTLDDLLAPQMIEGVEVYNTVAAAPIQYRAGSCGVVLFWTRRGGRGDGARLDWRKIVAGAGAAVLFIVLVLR